MQFLLFLCGFVAVSLWFLCNFFAVSLRFLCSFFAVSLRFLNLFSFVLDNASKEENPLQIQCEACSKSFPERSILKHIGCTNSCKEFYGPKFDALKKQKNRKKVQRYRAKEGNWQKELGKQRQSYSKGMERKDKKKKYYEKLSARKKDSAYNHLQYKKGIKFGPLFVCVWCHAGLFQKSVTIFTEKNEIKY